MTQREMTSCKRCGAKFHDHQPFGLPSDICHPREMKNPVLRDINNRLNEATDELVETWNKMMADRNEARLQLRILLRETIEEKLESKGMSWSDLSYGKRKTIEDKIERSAIKATMLEC
jgi:hypothetical protein